MNAPKRLRNTFGKSTRCWLQLVKTTVSVAVGQPTLDNKMSIPESWVVGQLPIYLSFSTSNRPFSLCLTDMTEEELRQLQAILNKAIDAALPICRQLDEAAFEALNDGADLDAVPNRALRGSAPQMFRKIDTKLNLDEMDPEDRTTVEEYLSEIRG